MVRSLVPKVFPAWEVLPIESQLSRRMSPTADPDISNNVVSDHLSGTYT